MHKHLLDERVVEGFTVRTYALPEDAPVRGNAVASGNPVVDRQLEDDIIYELESGKLSYWFTAAVVASKEGIELARDFLGCCSYRLFSEFLRPGSYHEDMVSNVVNAAKKAIRNLNA